MLVVGCGSSPKSTTPPIDQTPTTTEKSTDLPPPPGTGKATKTDGVDGITILTYETGDRVYVHKDGTCHAEYSSNCGQTGPEITTCNPPPPQQVQCPADAK